MPFAATAQKSNSRLFIPHDYQKDGIEWLLKHPFCGLFFPPGLGKTSVTLQAFKLMKHGKVADKLLVVAPLRVVYMVWPEEVKKWDNFNHLSVGILHGKDKNKVLKEEHDIYVINPEGLSWLAVNIGRKEFMNDTLKWALVIDESTNFKNGTSQRFKTMKNLAPKFHRRIILTGTPAPNGLINLWSQIYLLDRGTRLGSFITAFRNTFFTPAGYMGYDYRIQEDGAERIYAAINDIVMHKSIDEINMPELLNNTIKVELPKEARTVYNEMEDEFAATIGEEEVFSINAAVKSGKLRQIANGGLYDEEHRAFHLHDEKTKAVMEIAGELDGRPMMVMYEFKHDLARLRAAFPHAPIIGGGVSMEETRLTVEAWNRSEIPVLLVYPGSAGHGLNLQEGTCHDVVWHSIPWDLELYDQTIARVWRQGLDNPVTVHHIVAADTKDEQVTDVLVQKDRVQKDLLNAVLK